MLPSGFGGQRVPHLDVLLQLINHLTPKDTSFEWGPEKKVETALQSTLLLGPREPTEPMVLEEAVVDRVAIWSL